MGVPYAVRPVGDAWGDRVIPGLTTTLSVAVLAVFALLPFRPRHSRPFSIPFAIGWWMNELPFIGLWWLLVDTAGTLLSPTATPGWMLLAGMTALVALILVRILLRARAARRVLSTALQATYGPSGAVLGSRPPWWRIMLLPIVAWRPDVRRLRNRRYGPARFGNLLDVYVLRRRRGGVSAPVLVYLHGGGLDGSGFGEKSLFAHALMYRFAARGWVCISANYRMRGVRYPDQVADAYSVVDWTRTHTAEFGGDPDTIFLVGGSSGANLAAAAAFSGAPVRGIVGLNGYWGPVGGASAPPGSAVGSPGEMVMADAPPCLIVHGAMDSLVRREDARALAAQVSAASHAPVTYAELPGADHNFDFFPSLRLQGVGDGIVRFTELTLGSAKTPHRPHDSR